MTTPLANLTNRQQRIIITVFGILLLSGFILFPHPLGVAALFGIISWLTQTEFYRLLETNGNNRPLTRYGTIVGTGVHILIYLVEQQLVSATYYLLLGPAFVVIFLIKLYDRNYGERREESSKKKIKKKRRLFRDIGYTILGILYVAVPMAMMNALAMVKTGQDAPPSLITGNSYDSLIVLGILLILWSNDITAYLVGSAISARNPLTAKLFLRISPGKTWAGFWGGAIAGTVMTTLLSVFSVGGLTWWQWAGTGLIIVVVGTYGDLVESSFKGSIGVKDSGSTIPGHGGFLDRFDGLLLAAPVILVFLALYR